MMVAHRSSSPLSAILGYAGMLKEESEHGDVPADLVPTLKRIEANALHGGRIPVIVTGAMRHPSLPGPDGPANLAAAVACAADPTCRDQGVLVAFDDTIHAASWVQKRDTTATGAFWSPSPLGWLAEGRPALRSRRQRTLALDLPAGDLPFVPILKPGLDELPRLLDAALHAGAAGLVLELSGGGHATSVWADALESAARHVPVVFARR